MGGWGDGGPCAAASHIEAIRQRLEAESPFFQRLQLEPLLNLRFEKKAHVKRVHGCSLLRSEEKLPSIEEILLSHLPALTLVVLRSGTWHMAGDLHEYVPGW